MYFKPKVTLVCALLVVGMVRLSVWQWHRHLEKQVLVKELDKRLEESPINLQELLVSPKPPHEIAFRRVLIDGTFDYEHEILLRNRRYKGAAGVHVLTPLKINQLGTYILIDRGFLPLSQSARDIRKVYHGSSEVSLLGLLKEGADPHWIAPQDPPTGDSNAWVDSWLRVDLKKIQKQLPYQILPFYAETMEDSDPKTAQSEIVRSSSGREELLFLGFKDNEIIAKPDTDPNLKYPVPIFDTVIPPDRHLGYVYEWGFMAVVTLLIGVVLQLRPPRGSR